MTAPLNLRIEAVRIHAASAAEARGLADALPAALERALTAAWAARGEGAASVRSAALIDAGEVAARTVGPGSAGDLADSLARRLIDAALSGGRPR